jgi:hypothetical protein
MMNLKHLFYSFVLCLCIIGCKSDTPQLQESETSLFKEEIPQDFMSFYDRFHSDIDYQLDHVIFPLSQKTDSTKWEKEEWLMHKPFNTQGGEFTRSYTHLKGIVVENIQDQKGLFRIERRFSKSNDGYDLIYYKITNAFEDSDFVEDMEEENDVNEEN